MKTDAPRKKPKSFSWKIRTKARKVKDAMKSSDSSPQSAQSKDG